MLTARRVQSLQGFDFKSAKLQELVVALESNDKETRTTAIKNQACRSLAFTSFVSINVTKQVFN